MKPLGLYIHIPFCKSKCRYCDFLSFAGQTGETMSLYKEQLIREIIRRSEYYLNEYSVDTIFLGGGTPTILPIEYTEEIFDVIYSRFRVEKEAEITIEANPGTVDQEYLKALNSAGFNRISFGVQSFSQEKLDYLGRIHSADDSKKAFYQAWSAGFSNINIDMIFAVPGETAVSWEEDLGAAMKLAPDHISFYALQIEEGTPVYEDIMNGRAEAVDEIEDRRMYHHAVDTIIAAGYEHYEISNASLPGFRSRHNIKYWSLDDYLGLGLGSHSYISSNRFSNVTEMSEYVLAKDIDSITAESKMNKPGDDMSEYVFLGLRRTEGIDLDDFRKRFGHDFDSVYSDETRSLEERDLLVRSGNMLQLTRLGLDVGNVVFAEYV